MPHSLVVNDQDELASGAGNTGSTNFPITANAYQDSFVSSPSFTTDHTGFSYPNGSGLYIARLSADGTTSKILLPKWQRHRWRKS
ncbi:MAG: hypothetical protein U5L96_04700 [Owenweeksia sp.]|nr:hypothetical protein [Owenweeksia sp.]